MPIKKVLRRSAELRTFDIEAINVDTFVDQYTIDGWLPLNIALKLTRKLCWIRPCAWVDTDLIRCSSEELSVSWQSYFKNVIRELEHLKKDTVCQMDE